MTNEINPVISKVAEKADWRMTFPAHDAPPPGPPERDLELEARLIDLAIDCDTAVAMEGDCTASGIPIFDDYMTERPRPFAVRSSAGVTEYR
jgi:hypothetical protein